VLTPIELVRQICGQHKIPSHFVLGASTRLDVVDVRKRCIQAVAKANPKLPIEDIAELFAVQPRAIKRLLSSLRKTAASEPPRVAWPEPPAAILQRRLAALSPGLRASLNKKRRTKRVVRERWSIIQEIHDACPGIYPSEIAELIGIDRSCVRHALMEKQPYADLV